MSVLISRPGAGRIGRDADIGQFALYCEHILLQFKAHRAFTGGFVADHKRRRPVGSKPGIKIYPSVIVYENTGIELQRFSPAADGRAVMVLQKAEEFIFSSRFIADRDRDQAIIANTIIEIIPAVSAAANIWCKHGIEKAVIVLSVLFLAIDDALIPPVRQILDRR